MAFRSNSISLQKGNRKNDNVLFCVHLRVNSVVFASRRDVYMEIIMYISYKAVLCSLLQTHAWAHAVYQCNVHGVEYHSKCYSCPRIYVIPCMHAHLKFVFFHVRNS